MTSLQVENFMKESPLPDELQMHSDITIQWLKTFSSKDDRPREIEDAVDELIGLLAKVDERYAQVKASHKKCRFRRYKSLYDTYNRVMAKYDKDQIDIQKAQNRT